MFRLVGMEGSEIQSIARVAAEVQRSAELVFPFGPEHEVYKVGGKIFMMCTEVPGAPIVTLKSDPEESRVLQLAHDNIRPGWHMNKQHWVTLWPAGALVPVRKGEPTTDRRGVTVGEDFTPQLIEELVQDAYLRVVLALPRSQRPLEYRDAS